MSKAVLTIKAQSAYKDLPETQYHFPKTYLKTVQSAIGDWIIYYEPRRLGRADTTGGRQSYVATARIASFHDDSEQPGHYFAQIEDYIEFDTPIAFNAAEIYPESALQHADGSTNGNSFRRAVRPLPEEEYQLICDLGFARARATLANVAEAATGRPSLGPGLQEMEHPFVFEAERQIVEQRWNRPLRDAAFRDRVVTAYDNSCAFTGLSIINGGGKPEVQAAHIRPVKDGGPDSPRNGLALSQTVHWMFDRGLVAVNDDSSILTSSALPDQAKRLLNNDGKVIRPADPLMAPHPEFLRYHRERIFKG